MSVRFETREALLLRSLQLIERGRETGRKESISILARAVAWMDEEMDSGERSSVVSYDCKECLGGPIPMKVAYRTCWYHAAKGAIA